VDFLVEAHGADGLHDALTSAGAVCLHRSLDAANYGPGTSSLAPVDCIYARRERAVDMLERARLVLLRAARVRVPVVDAEALIGLKLQALVNAPSRRARDEADIRALIAVIERLALATAHLAGCSYGSITALLAAVKRPELVRTLEQPHGTDGPRSR
jgi:pimeloyl-ACP methyl ester carboxylesterase